MNTDFSNMSVDIAILNKEELEFKKYTDTLYNKLTECCKELMECDEIMKDVPNLKKEIELKKNKVFCKYDDLCKAAGNGVEYIKYRKEMPSIRTVDNLKGEIEKIKKEIIMANQNAMEADPMNANQFICRKCGWGCTATLVGAPTKCGGCGSKDYLERAVVVTSKGKVKNPKFIKFNPDTNKHNKRMSHKQEQDIDEKIDKLSMEIDKRLKSFNSNKLKEDKPMELKTYVVKCTSDKCGFAYETNDKPDGTHKHTRCQRCGFATSHTEKQPEKKISRFDR